MNPAAASQNESFDTSSPLRTKFRTASILLIVGLWAAIYLSAMFSPALLDDVDTVHAEAAREMILRHDWVTLYVNGIRYLEKAPLMYWGIAVSYKVFGVADWSTRLPLILGILAWLLAVYALWPICIRRKGRLVLSRGISHFFGSVSLHPFPDSRRVGGSVAYAELVFFLAITR